MSLKKGNKLIGYFVKKQSTDLDTSDFESVQSVDMLEEQWNDYSDMEENHPLPDKNEALLKIYRKILEQQQSKPKKFVVLKSNNLRRIAAMLLVPLMAAGMMYVVYNQLIATQYIEKKNPKGTRTEFYLPDGTRVWLNVMSSIKYPEKFTENQRIVEISGEAFLDVATDSLKPFVVKAGIVSVQVYGTSFNVNAYPAENHIETILQEGKVNVSIAGGKSLILHPNQKISVSRNTKKYTVTNVDAERLTSWKFGKLVFDNVTITNIINKLQRIYNTEIELQGNKSATYSFTLRNERIEQVFELLNMTSPIKYRKTGNKYIVTVE